MAYTYTLPFASDTDRVRFHLGDTAVNVSAGDAPKFSDEEISAVISDQGSYQKAVLACIRNLIMKVSDPNFRADWLTVENDKAAATLAKMLLLKQEEFGIFDGGAMGTESTKVYRVDSMATQAPDYSEND